ncbi:hypothetical protein ACJX0J_033300, partial [Zea mays]
WLKGVIVATLYAGSSKLSEDEVLTAATMYVFGGPWPWEPLYGTYIFELFWDLNGYGSYLNIQREFHEFFPQLPYMMLVLDQVDPSLSVLPRQLPQPIEYKMGASPTSLISLFLNLCFWVIKLSGDLRFGLGILLLDMTQKEHFYKLI